LGSLCCLAIANADPYKIPKSKEVKIDGSGEEWAVNASLYVGDLIDIEGRPVKAEDCSTGFRLGWDATGLIAVMHVRDDSRKEKAENMYLADSVEFFIGTEVGGKNRYQVVIGPGADPEHAELRTFLNDQRAEKTPPLAVEAAREVFDGGYFLEVRLPWKNLGIEPKAGAKLAFQAMINDLDAGEERYRAVWFPGLDTSTDPSQALELELVEGESDTVPAMARAQRIGDEYALRVFCATVTGSERVVGFATAEDTVVAKAIVPETGTVGGTLYRPEPDLVPATLTATVDGKKLPPLRLYPERPLTKRDFYRFDYTLIPSVFEGDTFPALKLRNREKIESAIGPVTLAFRFLDAAQKEVQRPEKPGRYGVEMTLTAPSGDSTVYQHTLYRQPAKVKWAVERVRFEKPVFPVSMGLDPAVLADNAPYIGRQFTGSLERSLGQEEWQAILLAGLSESKPLGDAWSPLNDPSRLNADWWHRFRQAQGQVEPYDRMVYLPKEYEADPQKKWPLVLFLHGAGDGDTPELLRKWGPPKEVKNGRDFPFIMAAPRSEPGPWMWWYAPRVAEFLDEMEKTYRVDKDRVYVTGLSMGGNGAWRMAQEYPERIAAIAPFCGRGEVALAPRMKNVPVWAFHGEKDTDSPVEWSRDMVAALEATGAKPKLTVFPDKAHQCWDDVYTGTEIYDWLLAQRRQPAAK
jgi:predicted esterase